MNITSKSRETCNVCESPGHFTESSEKEHVRSNLTKFSNEKFEMWRCNSCGSLHSKNFVDLDHYYKDYPFQTSQKSVVTKLLYKKFAKQIESYGITKKHKILDYGCGSGALAKELKKLGYNVKAFDKYTPRLNDQQLLEQKYDFIILQDVIEHVEEPKKLLDELYSFLNPGGKLFIGTPNAEKLNLKNQEKYIHALHQPYHLHILSKKSLISLVKKCGFKLEIESDIYYVDTFYPMINLRFGEYYLNLFNNNADDIMNGFRFHWKLLTPKGLALAFFGRLAPVKTQMSVVLTKVD
ncbi:MAG: class I SAM-dependent methyltransferase [bacterium]